MIAGLASFLVQRGLPRDRAVHGSAIKRLRTLGVELGDDPGELEHRLDVIRRKLGSSADPADHLVDHGSGLGASPIRPEVQQLSQAVVALPMLREFLHRFAKQGLSLRQVALVLPLEAQVSGPPAELASRGRVDGAPLDGSSWDAPRIEQEPYDRNVLPARCQEQRRDAVEHFRVQERSPPDEDLRSLKAAVICSHVEGSLFLRSPNGIDVRATVEKAGDDLRVPFASRVVQRGETLLVPGFGVRSSGKKLADDDCVAQVGCDVERSDARVQAGVGIGAMGEQQPHHFGVAAMHGEEQRRHSGGLPTKVRRCAARQKVCDSPRVSVPAGEEELLVQVWRRGRLSIHVIRG
ncbi:MAG TPA: hypothetical protein VH988_34685 [Thermoanaerobaculia bacterium]|nr:hypothetical protein [Thermoanaerobaculia bacterium]